jgi:RimJ/RimL family protein N-acetyltransferase
LVWEQHPAHDRWQEPVFRAFFADALAMGGALVVIDMASGKIIGSSRCQGHDPDKSCGEIGWTFLVRSHWGGSYNREVKRLMLAHAFRFVERMNFMVGAGNIRSRRAMEKIGRHLTDYHELRLMAGTEIPHVLYEITRDKFASGPFSA